MGRRRHYKWEVEDLIGHIMNFDYSLPEAVKILGGRPCLRTVRYWIAKRNPLRSIYRQKRDYWKCARFSYPGILKDYAHFQQKDPEIAKEYKEMLGGLFGHAVESKWERQHQRKDFGPYLVSVILHGSKMKREKHGKTRTAQSAEKRVRKGTDSRAAP